MTSILIPLLAALAGMGLLSLTVQRHRATLLRSVFGRWLGGYATLLLRIGGVLCLVLSFGVTLAGNLQLGAFYWSAYAMAAGLIVTGIHSYAERHAVAAVGVALFALAAAAAL